MTTTERDMTLLFADRWAPMTSSIGLIELDLERAVDAFVAWQQPIQSARHVALTTRAVGGGLEEMLRLLPPLTSVEARRFSFASTHSGWVAYFDNGHRGTDCAPPMSYLAQTIGCRAIRATAVPHHPPNKMRDGRWRGRYGAVIFELYGAEVKNYSNTRRSVAVVNDGGQWTFDQFGEPLPFEHTERYDARRLRDRFDFAALAALLKGLGVAPFDPAFYGDDGIVIEKTGPVAVGLRERTLEEVQAEL